MPQVNAYRKPDSLGKELLYSLIAEKLWAKEAENLGYDKTDYFKMTFDPLQKMFLKDALFKEEVEKKVTISPEDIAKGITRSKYKNITYIIPFIDSSETFATYKSLIKGITIDSVIKSHHIDTNNVFEIKYGMMDDERIEDIIFKLKT